MADGRGRRLAGDRRVDGDRRAGVDERVELQRQALRGPPWRRRRVVRCDVVVGERRRIAVARCRGARLLALARRRALRAGATRLPGAVRDDAGEDDAAERREGDGEGRAHRRRAGPSAGPLPSRPGPRRGAERRTRRSRGPIQAASARRIAPGMSTVTMRDTPCSCIVTPISCSAISMAMRLWLMKRNCVAFDISVTSLA